MKDLNEIQKILEEPKGWLKLSPSDIMQLNDYCKQLVIENQQLILSSVSQQRELLKIKIGVAAQPTNTYRYENRRHTINLY